MPLRRVSEIPGQDQDAGARFTESDTIKARIHCWLAWQIEPGQPFGTALTAATFQHNAAIAVRFVEWMQRLFRDP